MLASTIHYGPKKSAYNDNRKRHNPIIKLGPVRSLDELAERLTEHPEALDYTLDLMNDGKEKRRLEWFKTFDSSGSKQIVIFDRKFVTRNVISDQWYCDATFSPRPQHCGYQLLTVEFGKLNKVNRRFFSNVIM